MRDDTASESREPAATGGRMRLRPLVPVLALLILAERVDAQERSADPAVTASASIGAAHWPKEDLSTAVGVGLRAEFHIAGALSVLLGGSTAPLGFACQLLLPRACATREWSGTAGLRYALGAAESVFEPYVAGGVGWVRRSEATGAGFILVGVAVGMSETLALLAEAEYNKAFNASSDRFIIGTGARVTLARRR